MLLDSIERYTLIRPGDGALIVTMVYSFARVSAAVTMKAGNCFQHRKRCRLRLHQKGSKRHEAPCAPSLEPNYPENFLWEVGFAQVIHRMTETVPFILPDHNELSNLCTRQELRRKVASQARDASDSVEIRLPPSD
jgi:hypothetical protein